MGHETPEESQAGRQDPAVTPCRPRCSCPRAGAWAMSLSQGMPLASWPDSQVCPLSVPGTSHLTSKPQPASSGLTPAAHHLEMQPLHFLGSVPTTPPGD